MSDAAFDPNTPLPWSEPRRVADLAGRKPNRFDIRPDAATCAAIAQWAGISAVKSLRLKGTLTAKGRSDWLLEAAFTARVVQPCAVTLAPVTTDLAEEITRHYLADLPEPTGDEVEMPEDDTLEPLRAEIDLAAVALEALELALPLYPRATELEPDARLSAVPDGAEELTDEATRPFANLRDLLAGKGNGSGEND
ncbi:DUF177 domain-containing protein [Sedimentimonas flavescens]|uniref:DUF177 domain-containing protein n=1 Tax=Sedimentimonas flavescens TaxID=2851012 RepID=A0ABT2ZY89_9RHOB|nr:YceD family protein [Sedimentimonas flavescens]MBW0157769.1 DUF177 domain-containing protein [Sedimentimonas flavescens]MCT2540759.1 DUF177 domain-containing protein [Sedimentimonas flavescens]MCV2878722.1 DUF177 domain-containing protein [Sedimentimonas flavescens]WBL31909.1 YceD family protein [Sinirhodobacter sp. HNIBRBA609]